jgi:hypothetical protein
MRSPSASSDVSVKPSFFRTTPAKKPRTESLGRWGLHLSVEARPDEWRQLFEFVDRHAIADKEPLPDCEVVHDGPRAIEAGCSSACMTWSAAFHLSEEEYRNHLWSIFAEEVDRMRPGTYADEPRYETSKDSNFVDTGPRFAGRLPLDNLQIT